MPLHIVGLDAVGLTAPPETGTTFAANAILKARNAATLSGLPALADDSGPAVIPSTAHRASIPALHASEDADDEASRRLLIAALADVPEAARTDAFVCAIALARPDGAVAVVAAACEGHLLTTPARYQWLRARSALALPDRGVTMAELSLDEKNAISHRAQALGQQLCATTALRNQ